MTISPNGYRSLLAGIGDKTETTYVIGHRNPDSDSVGSAMAFAHLLRELGIRAEAAICGSVNNEHNLALKISHGNFVPLSIQNCVIINCHKIPPFAKQRVLLSSV